MKKLKKIALLVVILMLSTILNVYAAGTAQITVTPSVTEVKAGDTFTITLAAKCETGIEGIEATLVYDKTKLKLTEKAAEGFTSMSGEVLETGEYKVSILFTDTTDAPTEANFATLTFEALDTVATDEVLTVKLTEIEVGDSDDEWIKVEDKEVALTVVTEENSGDGEQTPDGGEQTPDGGEQTPEGGEQTPDGGEQTPEGGEQTPEGGEQTPEGGEQTPDDGEQGEQIPDNTIADKPINNAGLANFASIAVVGIAVLAIALYAKCRTYRDVK